MALNVSKKTSPQDVDSSAKGDLIVNNGSDIVSLPAGSDGQVLTANSVTTEGIEWAALGGLNLTEVKYITTTTIQKPTAGTFFISSNPGGVFDFIGTDENTVAYSNVVTDDEVDILGNGVTDLPGLVDKNYSTNAFNFNSNFLVVDLKRPAYFNLEAIGLSMENNGATRTYNFEGSNDGTNWDAIETNLGISIENGYVNITDNNNFYRYFRITRPGNSTTHNWKEFEMFGEIVPSNPTYNIVDADNNKMLLVPFGNPTQVNMPTGVGTNGFTCQITATVSAALPITINPLPGVTFIGQNFTIDNVGEVATIIQANPDTYVVSISRGKLPLSAKGDLLTHDGNENVVQTIGADDSILIADSTEASGIRWDSVDSVVGNPFTAQRLDLNSALQLTGSNARYLYLSAVGGTQDVVLTDPPSTNDFFYIVNRDSNNPIQIKEIAAGGVVQTLNSVTPAAQCHYDGTEWQIISFGTI